MEPGTICKIAIGGDRVIIRRLRPDGVAAWRMQSPDEPCYDYIVIEPGSCCIGASGAAPAHQLTPIGHIDTEPRWYMDKYIGACVVRFQRTEDAEPEYGIAVLEDTATWSVDYIIDMDRKRVEQVWSFDLEQYEGCFRFHTFTVEPEHTYQNCTIQHGRDEDCPMVQSGAWKFCQGHAAEAPNA
jgi:hypothetical protein